MHQLADRFPWTKHIDFMLIDSAILSLAFWFSYARVFGTPFFWYDSDWVSYLIFVLVLNMVITFLISPYSDILRRPYYMEVVRSFQMMVANALSASFMFYLLKVGALYSRGTSFYMYGLYFALSALCNVVWKKLLLSGKVVVKTSEPVSLFVIGDADTIDEVIGNVTAGDYMPYSVCGVHLVDGTSAGGFVDSVPLVADDYLQYILDHNIRHVLVATSLKRVDREVLQQLNANAIDLSVVMESTFGFQPEDQYLAAVGVYKALGVRAFSFRSNQLLYLGIKRILDILFGLIGLVVLMPIAILVKLAYLASGDRSSILYCQERVGKNGEPIHIWKFRSMVSNAEEILPELLKDERYRREWFESQKLDEDPRITKVGNVLRKTSVDELPQIINVLKGDMSLVGPRPLVEGELEKFGGLKLYQRLKPGITGWWACNGRSNIEYRERLELEYYYVKHCSFTLDVLCVLRTFSAILRRDGAR